MRKFPRFYFLFNPFNQGRRYNILLLSGHDILYEFAKDIKYNTIKYFFHNSGIIYFFKSIIFQKLVVNNHPNNIATKRVKFDQRSINTSNIFSKSRGTAPFYSAVSLSLAVQCNDAGQLYNINMDFSLPSLPACWWTVMHVDNLNRS